MGDNIGVVTTPITRSGIIPLSNLIKILHSLSNNITLITGGDAYEYFQADDSLRSVRINYSSHPFFVFRALKYISLQIRMSFLILQTSKKVDTYIFFFGGDTQFLPVFIARLWGNKVKIFLAGSSIKTHRSKNDPLTYGLKLLRYLTCTTANSIIIYSNRLIGDYSLEKWTDKIVVAYEHQIDFDKFRLLNECGSRETIVGYVGRFSREKGILQLLHAIPDIIKDNPEIKFLLIGDGALQDSIEAYIAEKKLNDNIILPGWIDHDSLPHFLNRMELLVIPSDTEGLPNIMLEAMACGTPVLATPVGAIPDVIIDGKTGFIMENNSSGCIAENIARVLDSSNLDQIAEKGRQFVDENFSFDSTVVPWKEMFEEK